MGSSWFPGTRWAMIGAALLPSSALRGASWCPWEGWASPGLPVPSWGRPERTGPVRICRPSVDPPPPCRYRLPPLTAPSGVGPGQEPRSCASFGAAKGARLRVVCNPIRIRSGACFPSRHPSYDLLRDLFSGLMAIVRSHWPSIFLLFSALQSSVARPLTLRSRPTPTRSSETVIHGLRRVPTA